MEEIYEKLAKMFIAKNGYSKEEFKDVDISNDLEGEVSEFVDSFKGSFDNYEEYSLQYKDSVYEKVCILLGV